jgi:hypothetical protein
MRYTLITKAGKVRMFYILSVAELYQQIYGGYLLTNDILNEKEATA